MIERKPQKQLLLFVMLALLSMVSVVMTANESIAGTLGCYSCHGNGTDDALPLDTAATDPVSYRNITTGAIKGNHQTHLNGLNVTVANQSMCARCHNNSNYTTSHRSGTITLRKGLNGSTLGTYASANLVDAGTYVFKNQTSVPTLGSCSTTNCHFESVSPTWGTSQAAVNCSTCHAALPPSVPWASSHDKHTTQYGGVSSCVKCHADHTGSFQHATSAGNVGRNIDLSRMPGTYVGSNFNYLPSQSATRAVGTCTNVCHSSGQSLNGLSATPVTVSADWGNAGTGACGTCHGIGNIATGSHAKHLAAGLGDTNCGNCHSGATSATINSPNHVDGVINVEFGTYNRNGAPGNGYGTCSAASCHNNGTIALPVITPSWGSAAPGGACTVCHGTTATMATGSHSKHLAGTSNHAAVCGDCHTSAVAGTNGGISHLDGTVNVAAGLGYPTNITKHSAGTYAGNCSTSYCHSSGQAANGLAGNPVYAAIAPTWGGTAACGSCHATTTLATGSHTKHLASSTNCGSCHVGATSNGYASAIHIDGQINVDAALAYTAGNAPGNGYGTCSTNSCHNNGQTGAQPATPTWGATPAACSACHASPMVSGAHTKHLTTTTYHKAVCADCHTSAVDGTNGGSFHLDGNVSVATGLGYPTNIVKHAVNVYSGTCSTSYCHSSGQTATGQAGLPVYAAIAPSWGATVACGSCHATTTLATGSHALHLASSANCGSCHVGATSTTYASTAHVDGTINVDAAIGYSSNATPGNGYGKCSTASCHNDGTTGVQGATPTWGVSSAACSVCHAKPMATGSHTKHLSGTLYKKAVCADCHTNAVDGTTGGSFHLDGSVNVATGLGYPTNIVKHAVNVYSGSCSTSYCHSSGQGLTGGAVTPIYAATAPTWGGTAACGSCHATTTLATGSHNKHLAYNTNCGSCHLNATLAAYNNATHVDGQVNVDAALSYNSNATPGNGYGRCTTTLCHSNGATAAVQTPTWGITPAACTACHGTTGTLVTGNHNKHLTGTTFAAISCGSCHAGALVGVNGGTAHLNNMVNISTVSNGSSKASITPHSSASTVNCSTSYCHGGGNPASNDPILRKPLDAGAIGKTAPVWGNGSLNCNACHGAPPINADHAAATPTNCNGCHGHVNSNGTSFNKPDLHADGIIQGGKCDACHGYPPVPVAISKTGTGLGHMGNYSSANYENYSGGGGVHAVAGHLALSIKASDAFGPCATCHPSDQHNQAAVTGFGGFSTQFVQVVIATKYKFDKNRPIVYNAKQSTGPGKKTGTCTNVSCHFQKTLNWSAESYTQQH